MSKILKEENHNQKKNQFDVIPTVLVLLSLISIIFAAIVPVSGTLRNSFIAVVGLSCYFYAIAISTNKKVISYSFVLSLFMTGSMLLSYLYNRNASLGGILWVWAYMGIALCLYLFRINHKLSIIIYYLLSSYLITVATIGISASSVFNNSENVASSLSLLILSIGWYLVYKNTRKVHITPIVIQLIISIWGIGRAGLITSIFMIMAIMIYIIMLEKKKIRNSLIFFILVIGTYIFITRYFGLVTEETLNRFSALGVKSSRVLIYDEYINGMKSNMGHFFFGVPYDFGFLLNIFKNPHNSFLMLHSKYGIMGFTIISFLLTKSITYLYKSKNWFYLIIFTTLLIRSFFDWTSFPGAYDIMWFLFILEWLDPKEIDAKNKKTL